MIEKRNELVEKLFLMKDDNKSITGFIQSYYCECSRTNELNGNSIVNITPNEAFELIEKYYDKITKYMGVKPSKYSKPCIIIT